jgi:hypothetical protein
MPAMTALRLDAVLSVKIIHRIEPGAETTKRHNDVCEMWEISFDGLCVLSAFVATRILTLAKRKRKLVSPRECRISASAKGCLRNIRMSDVFEAEATFSDSPKCKVIPIPEQTI